MDMEEFEAISAKAAQPQKSEMKSLRCEGRQTSEKKCREGLPPPEWYEWYKTQHAERRKAYLEKKAHKMACFTSISSVKSKPVLFIFLQTPRPASTPLPYIKVIKSLPTMASEKMNQHFEMLGASLSKLYETGTYSDLIITCGNDTYQVHKAIVCPRSSFFTAACSGKFKEGQEGKINLPDDDPDAFTPADGNFLEEELSTTEHDDALKQFLQSQGHRFVGNRRVKGMVPKLAARIGPSSNLCLFAKVYALGEKYGILGLKAIALGKFEILAKGHFQTEDFRLAVQEVYTSTIDHDRGLRDVVVCTVEENIGLLNDEAFDAVVKYSDLGHDLLMKITSMRRAR
ncbi:uncharacterized protein FOBCDRAFT_245766 [Fusarium oxysporum Fo47]|nr:uncharacterized protein FOBCDRAFT_245766 [Fusarium oxysporum Fo47]WJG37254.1 hypothetical protein FOBCDRAFT_245766 [Fusarium oxysporum Fo47]